MTPSAAVPAPVSARHTGQRFAQGAYGGGRPRHVAGEDEDKRRRGGGSRATGAARGQRAQTCGDRGGRPCKARLFQATQDAVGQVPGVGADDDDVPGRVRGVQ